ncbi:EAL domain-containing protein [Rhodovulum sp. ES.010]|uniref:EAL domain-containing protein n=1 Tax=Rhodovulum sp. ES.010 TaxID=1882821 RepID=UPI0015881A43|nr:EAL domain-containing protein [Rhodovulum sp. ES.010]
MALVAATLDHVGALDGAKNAESEHRMASVQHDASGGIVFLAIDKKSLDAIGVWPWPRELHAQVVTALADLGATEILLDIDLSTASDSRSDTILVDALQKQGGVVMLPAFKQAGGVHAEEAAETTNLPLAMFRTHSWLVSVNVTPDADGRVRRYPFGQLIADEDVPSAASTLSGVFGTPSTSFEVNFGLRQDSVSRYSVVDLLEGRIPPEKIAGRSVVVGAHAIELGDRFSVPVHGILSGPMLHILAAETLAAGIAPVRLAAWPFLALIAVIAVGAALSPLGGRLRWLIGLYALLAAASEAGGHVLFARTALELPSAIMILALAVTSLVMMARELDLRWWLVRLATTQSTNMHRVLRRIITDSSDAIVVVDEKGTVIEMSRRARELFEIDGQERRLAETVPPEMAAQAQAAMVAFRNGDVEDPGPHELAFRRGEDTVRIEYTVTPSRLQRASRTQHALDDVVVGCVTARDVTLTRAQEARLDHMARFDELTGAMNRAEFLARLRSSLETGTGHAVFALNLHRFKTVNATLGRQVGDDLLRAFVKRIELTDPHLAEVARLGGDTFALFCAEADRLTAGLMGEGLITSLSQPYRLGGSSARTGIRLGIAIQADAGDTAERLLVQAELALDEARQTAGDGSRFFDAQSSERHARLRNLERALWSSIQNDEMFLVYQPQIRLAGMTVIGAEALVRWRHPEFGMVSPGEFIELAEGNGFIEELGRWVLERACRDALRWPAGTTVAVNVSPLQFQRSDVEHDVTQALEASGLDPQRLHVEITESMFVSGAPELIGTLERLRSLGPSLALDDFGSGFASFGYLSSLPLDKIKLDRMFMQDVAEGGANAAIVRSVRMLTAELGLTLICEGIETADERDVIRAIGVDQGQGYLFGKPMPQDDFVALFATDVTRDAS